MFAIQYLRYLWRNGKFPKFLLEKAHGKYMDEEEEEEEEEEEALRATALICP